MKKRLFLLLSLIVMAGSTAWANIGSGSCQNGTWVIDDNGKLTVNINGKMKDYGEGKARGTSMPSESRPFTSALAVRTSAATASTDSHWWSL